MDSWWEMEKGGDIIPNKDTLTKLDGVTSEFEGFLSHLILKGKVRD